MKFLLCERSKRAACTRLRPNSCCRAQRSAALVPACDKSEHVSSAQSAQHFEERNVVTINAVSITIKSITKVEAKRGERSSVGALALTRLLIIMLFIPYIL